MNPSDRQLIESVFAGDGEIAARMRAFDWSATPLGPVEQWPQALRAAMRVVLDDGRASEQELQPERGELRASEQTLAEASRPYLLQQRAATESEIQVDLLQQLPVSAWTLDRDGTPDFVNQVWLDYSGQTLDFVRSHPEAWMTAVHPEDRGAASKAFGDAIRAGHGFAFETRSLRARDETYRWHLNQAVVLRDEEGKVLKFVGTTTDIDDQKRAEEELRKGKDDLSKILDSIPGLVFVMNPSGRMELPNRQLLDYFGKTADELNAWAASDAIHPDDLPRAIEGHTRSIASGTPYDFELRYRRADGVYRWFQARNLPMRDSDGKITGWCGLLTDIEDRKCAEEKLRESERESRLIIDSIPGLTASLNAKGELEFLSKPLLDYYGRTLEEIEGSWRTGDFVHPQDLPRLLESLSRSLGSGDPFEIELRCKRFDGAYVWFELRGRPARDRQGHIARWYLLQTDIGDRKRAEEALLESERESRLIVDSIPGMVALISPTGDVEMVSRPLLDFFGRTIEELREWGTNDMIHPEDLPGVTEAFSRAMASDSPFEFSMRIRRWDGVYRWFQERGSPLRDRDGDITRWYLLITDIDDQKRAEEALRESEQEALLIVDGIPGLIAVLSTGGELERVNQPILDYFGKSLEECRQWAVDDSVHPDDRPAYLQAFGRSFAAGDPVEYEAIRVRRFDGVYRWFNIRGLPLRDRQGHIVRWHFLLTDVDDRKRAEEKLRESEHESRLIVDSIPGLIAVLDASSAVERVSQPLLDYLGKSLEELRQWAVDNTIHPDDRPAYLQAFERAFATGDPVEYEAVRIRRFDGVYRWFTMRGLPLRDRQGHIVRWYFLLTEVDDRKRAEDALRQAQGDLARINRVTTMGELAASLAHEVSQPISGAMINANVGLRKLGSDHPNLDEVREVFSKIVRDAKRATEVISRVRAQFEKGAANKLPLDVNEIIAETIAILRDGAVRHNIAVRTELAADLPLVVGDRVQLQQVMMNLILNSIEAMNDVDGIREIIIQSGRAEEGQILVSFRDTGIGLPPQIVEQIFDPFFTTKPHGTGMGLRISRSIIESHSGRLWAVSPSGRGATFQFTLPVQ